MPATVMKPMPRLAPSGLTGGGLLVAIALAAVPHSAAAELTLVLLVLSMLAMAQLGRARVSRARVPQVRTDAAPPRLAWLGRVWLARKRAGFAMPALPPGRAPRRRRLRRAARSPSPALSLQPVVPLYRDTPVHSWLGGAPHMPTDIAWPDLDGAPALFLAQIDCAEFPLSLWGGRGPRDGWLLLFASHLPGGHIALLHNSKRGHERRPEVAQRFTRLHPERVDLLGRVRGGYSNPPRWPVSLDLILTPDGLPSAPPAPAQCPEVVRLLESGDPAAPPLRPFNWTSAFLLLEAARSDLRWQMQVIAGFSAHDEDEDARRYLAQLERPMQQTDALHSQLTEAREAGLAFSDALADLLLRGMAQISVPPFAGDPAAAQPLLAQPQVREGYSTALRRYARKLYCKDPRALPEPHKALFEEAWTWLAPQERGLIGGPPAPRTVAENGAMEILRLPSSALLGWAFGPGGQGVLVVSMPEDALTAGDFSQATGRIIAA